MQLALDVQIPTELGGVEAAALYIDTEGSLMPTRMEQMALALQRHIAGVVKVGQEGQRGRPPAALATTQQLLSPPTPLRSVALTSRASRARSQSPSLSPASSIECTLSGARRSQTSLRPCVAWRGS